jgi:uncharacterized membrane protein YbhN (UPF0104 family)
LRKTVSAILKIGISAAIVVWLVWDALHDDPRALASLRDGPKNWGLLLLAAVSCSTAIFICYVRWWILVRALGMAARFRDTLRIGMVGYLFNLAPMGIVGGDLLKAWLLSREQGGRPAESLASVGVDRAVGMCSLFVVASIGILVSGLWRHEAVNVICLATLFGTLAGLAFSGVLLMPDVTGGRAGRLLRRVPYLGPPATKLVSAVRMYRHHKGALLAALLMSFVVHTGYVTGIHLIAHALPGPAMSYREHFVVAPLAAVTGAIPLPAGPQEGAMKYLYGELASAGLKGLVVTLVYRIITLFVAAVGVVYYFASRREVAEVLHEHEQAAAPASPALGEA